MPHEGLYFRNANSVPNMKLGARSALFPTLLLPPRPILSLPARKGTRKVNHSAPLADHNFRYSLLAKEAGILDFSGKGALRGLLFPSGLVLLATVILIESHWLSLPASAIAFYYYAVFGVGIVLAWRFHSSRVLFALLILLLSERALEFFSGARQVPATGPGRIAFEAITFLVPLNLLFLGWARERGLSAPIVASRLLSIFLQSVFVAVLCRPGQTSGFALFEYSPLNPRWFSWTHIPQPSLLAFLLAGIFLLIRSFEISKPVESGFFWTLIGSFLAFNSGVIGRGPSIYMATAALTLLIAIIETSYSMAYQDELTALPARRAFNEARLALQEPYALAMVDIDHFKQFNDTYGHDTGDQVLRLVAGKLAQVTGGGKAFRCGGEEFAIIFPGMSLEEATQHLELVRQSIESASFHVRGGDRRYVSRKNDRRKAQVRRGRLSRSLSPPRRSRGAISVTVSIGVAQPTAKASEIDAVIAAADKALYRAKANGRNRLEAG